MGDSHDNRRSRSASDAEVAQRKIFIGGLSYETTDENLKKYFSVFGNIEDAVVMKDPLTRRSRGFGFITFTTISSVDAAIEAEPHSIDARRVEVKRAVPKVEGSTSPVNASSTKALNSSSSAKPPVSTSQTTPKKTSSQLSSISAAMSSPPSTSKTSSPSAAGSPSTAKATTRGSRSNSVASNTSSNAATDDTNKFNSEEYAKHKIFVGGLHYDTRDADFRAYFENFGKVLHGEVMFNRETHKSRGFGFIIFDNEDGVDRVCDQAEHSIHGKAVEVKRAIPRSQMTPGSAAAGSGSPSLGAKPAPAVVSPSVNLRPNIRRAISGSTSTVLAETSNAKKTSSKAAAQTGSYAAVLKQGVSSAQGNEGSSAASPLSSPSLNGNTTELSIDDPMLNDSSDSLDTTRTTRAYSEPIVTSSSFFGEVGGRRIPSGVGRTGAITSSASVDGKNSDVDRFDLVFENLGIGITNPATIRPESTSPDPRGPNLPAWSSELTGSGLRTSSMNDSSSILSSASSVASTSNAFGVSWLSSPSLHSQSFDRDAFPPSAIPESQLSPQQYTGESLFSSDRGLNTGSGLREDMTWARLVMSHVPPQPPPQFHGYYPSNPATGFPPNIPDASHYVYGAPHQHQPRPYGFPGGGFPPQQPTSPPQQQHNQGGIASGPGNFHYQPSQQTTEIDDPNAFALHEFRLDSPEFQPGGWQQATGRR